jgi:hypothetical protein
LIGNTNSISNARVLAARLLLAGVVMAGVLVALQALLFPAQGLLRYFSLAVLIAAGGVAYFGLGFLLRGYDLGELKALLRRRRKTAVAKTGA